MAEDVGRSVHGVTVVVPTLHRGNYLAQCVADLLDQEYRPLEILIVDQSDEPDAHILELARANRDVVGYHQVDFRGLPKARNYAWQQARHDAIVYIDDDVRCDSAFVRCHARALACDGVGVVAGGIDGPEFEQCLPSQVGRFRQWTATPIRGFSATGERDVDHAPGGNLSCWRGVIELAGGFDEALDVGAALYEETELCLRVRKLGYRIRFDGRARLTHLVGQTGGCREPDLASYVWALGHNRGIVIRRHLAPVYWPTAVARAFLLGISYSRAYREPSGVGACLSGLTQGLHRGGRPVVCSRHQRREFDS